MGGWEQVAGIEPDQGPAELGAGDLRLSEFIDDLLGGPVEPLPEIHQGPRGLDVASPGHGRGFVWAADLIASVADAGLEPVLVERGEVQPLRPE